MSTYTTQKHVVTQSANGKTVHACLTQGVLGQQVGRNPHLLRLAAEVLAGQTLEGAHITGEYDLGRGIGYSDILLTGDNDTIFYARLGRATDFTRFVKHRKNDQTSVLSLGLFADEEGNYELRNIWIGPKYPPTPGDEDATAESAVYWQTHAVVYNGQSVLSSTITKDWPY